LHSWFCNSLLNFGQTAQNGRRYSVPHCGRSILSGQRQPLTPPDAHLGTVYGILSALSRGPSVPATKITQEHEKCRASGPPSERGSARSEVPRSLFAHTTLECLIPRHSKAAGSGALSRGLIPRLGLQPLADVPGALLTIGWPFLRKAVVNHVIALDAERVLNDPGGAVAVVAVDRLVTASDRVVNRPAPRPA
jgi:hypothetical protein